MDKEKQLKNAKLIIRDLKQEVENLKYVNDQLPKMIFQEIVNWLSQDGENDWRAWDSTYLDEFDKLEKKYCK